MNIINANLSFGKLSIRKKTNRIILHHAAAKTCDAATIHRWHKDRGWSGAGYHFLVKKNGQIYSLRPSGALGAHASGNNSDSIGICFEGNFDTEGMGYVQMNAGKELVAYLKRKYRINKVQRHKDVGSTSCPGKNFPFAEITTGAPATAGSNTKNTEPAKPSADKLAVDGYWGKNTTLRLQKIFGTPADGIVSNQHRCYRTQNPGLDSGWEWKDKPTGASALIKAIQKKVGATADGHIGPNTIKAIQKWMGTTQDGCFSKKSPCIKKLQQWCNDQ